MTFSDSSDLAGQTRVKVSHALDRQLAPLGLRALSCLRPKNGDRVIDIGCGAGQTCIQMAKAVGSSGSVLGVDISPAMVAAAKRRVEALPSVQILQGDAQTIPFVSNAFDALYSRFGVMFFRDPIAAFTNLRRALKADGRMAFVCWRRLEDNDLDTIPLRAARPVLPTGLTSNLDQADPFSFADPTQVKRMLTDTGFQNIQITPHDEAVGSGDLKSMLELALNVGPLGKIIRENQELRERVSGPVQTALESCEGPDGILLTAAVWIVTADAQKADADAEN